MMAIKESIKQARDITRGGLATVLNEIAQNNNFGIIIEEDKIPIKKEVEALTNVLGIDFLSLACEGRFLCICSKDNSHEVLRRLKEFDDSASIIGEVVKSDNVILKTRIGKRILDTPSGNLVPRIC